MSDIGFDLSKITAGQMADYWKAVARNDIDGMSIAYAAACFMCPPAWGSPNEAGTFSELTWADINIAAEAFAEAQRETRDNEVGEFDIEHDLAGVKGKTFVSDFLNPLNAGQVAKVAEFLSKHLVKAPKDWGKPGKPETYLNLPYYTVFLPLGRQVSNEARSGRQKKSLT
jgi:hypothetical protein